MKIIAKIKKRMVFIQEVLDASEMIATTI